MVSLLNVAFFPSLREGANDMNKYAIMRIEKRKMGAITKICNHHERLKAQYKSNPDIDPERTELNYHLKQPVDKYRPLVLKRIEETGAKRRKNSVVLQDALVTASPEWFEGQPYERQVEYFNHAYKYFAKVFGEENIISAVVHMDEAHLHMHLACVPITKDNRLSSKEIIGGPAGLRKHQDDFYEHMAEKFPDIMRGIPRTVTQRKHIPTEFYKNANMLYEHYEEINRAIDDIGVISTAKKKERVHELIGRYAPEMAQLSTQARMTDDHIKRLETALKDSKMASAKKGDIIYDQRNEIEQLKDKLGELHKRQVYMQRVIDRIPPEVLEQMSKDEKARRKSERDAR